MGDQTNALQHPFVKQRNRCSSLVLRLHDNATLKDKFAASAGQVTRAASTSHLGSWHVIYHTVR